MRCKVVAHIKSDAIEKALAAIRAAERLPIDLSYCKVMQLHHVLLPFARLICLFTCYLVSVWWRLVVLGSRSGHYWPDLLMFMA